MLRIANEVMPAKAGIQNNLPGVIEKLQTDFDHDFDHDFDFDT